MSINTTANRYSDVRRKAEFLGASFEVTREGVKAFVKQGPFEFYATMGWNIDEACERFIEKRRRYIAPIYEGPTRLVGYDRAAFLAI